MMDVEQHVEQLRLDGERLAEVVSSCDPAAPVPTCPDWQVRDPGPACWRRASDGQPGSSWAPASSLPDGDLEQLVGGWPSETELVAWFRAGHRALVEALPEAPPDLETWTFLDAPTPLAFWARRQAHETAIHRVDAEIAGGSITGFPPAFAADGLDELMLRFANRPGRTLPVESPRSMIVCATDVSRSWGVTFAPTGFQIQADPEHVDPEFVVAGGASDLDLMLWTGATRPGWS